LTSIPRNINDRRFPYYYRTEDGAEIDLVFERGGTIEMAVEIKRSTSPTLSRGFNLARDVLKPRDTYLVHGGNETWPMAFQPFLSSI
jgi:uncharacterized protein